MGWDGVTVIWLYGLAVSGMRRDGMAIDHRTGGCAYNVYNETPLGARRLILETKDEWVDGWDCT